MVSSEELIGTTEHL